jgi:hypothetical protein
MEGVPREEDRRKAVCPGDRALPEIVEHPTRTASGGLDDDCKRRIVLGDDVHYGLEHRGVVVVIEFAEMYSLC